MVLRLIVSDNDGCFGNYAKFGRSAHEDLTPHTEDYDRIREFLSQYQGIGFSMCTGRSLINSAKIIEELGMNVPCALEMGTLIYDPRTSTAYVLAYQHGHADLLEAQDEVRRFNATVAESNGKIAERLGCEIKHLSDRKNVVSIEFDGKTGYDVHGQLEKLMRPELIGCIRDRTVLVVPSTGAIDVMPAIGKGAATRHIMNKLGIRQEEVLSIGDSSHTDIAMLRETGYAGCPSNSDDGLRRYVESRGRKGFVSSLGYAEGVLDTLRHAEKEGWF